MIASIGVRIPAPICSRMREEEKCGVTAGADDHQFPDQFAGGEYGGHLAVHRRSIPAQMTTNFQINLRVAGTEDIKRYTVRSTGWEGRRSIKWTVRPWAFYGLHGVTVRNRRDTQG